MIVTKVTAATNQARWIRTRGVKEPVGPVESVGWGSSVAAAPPGEAASVVWVTT
jgi:hypothetical protein